MDAEHLPEGVLVRLRVHVAVENVLDHVQEGRVILLGLNLACKNEGREMVWLKEVKGKVQIVTLT